MSDFVPFKNLFNEWFAKDTSRKVKAALHAKFAAGERTFAYAPLGYIRHPEVKNAIVIDVETRWIIEKIFDLASHGAGAAKIARVLVDEHVPTAGWLNYQRSGTFAHIYEGQPEKKQLLHVDLTTLGEVGEAEWIDFRGGRCYYSDGDGKVFLVDFEM